MISPMQPAGSALVPPLVVDRRLRRPLYRQIYDGLREGILDGSLRAGQRLPSTRSLAQELGVSRIPVLNAFEQLLAEGFVEGRVGSGTYVVHALPSESAAAARSSPGPQAARAGRRTLSRSSAPLERELGPWFGGPGPFRVGDVAGDQFPYRAWARLVARHARRLGPDLISYGPRMGYPALREAVAAYLRTARGVRCEADQVIVVSGSQQALDVAARSLVDPGSAVWMEEPGYRSAMDAFVAAGARLVPVPVDEEGLDVAAGIERAPRARAAFVTPSHQFPLGSTMSAARRMQLLDWARRSGAWVIEDDYDSEFRYESLPVASLQGMDRDARVIYIGTFSKVLYPGLRLGYLVVPPDLVPRFSSVRRALDICPPTSAQAVLADFMREGKFARHLRRMRQLYGERRTVLTEALRQELGGTLEVLGKQAGTHLVAVLPSGRRDRPLCERAAEQGLWVMPLTYCYLARPRLQGLVLGYGGTPTEEIPAAVHKLAAVLASGDGEGG
jgi:GntR family transcriptional regulator/MocR family aminotransferase